MKAHIAKQLFAGKFEIQGEIAKGQTGTILYGYDIGLRQEVAIKVYHSHINGRLVRGKTFIEKSKPLLLIDHPNLIKIFNVEEQDDNPVVFMEFFDAPNLHQFIRDKGTLSVQEMLLLAREIAEVFVHTHFQGIIHGTLHPGHVLVGPKGQIKVMDLGLSWILMDILPNSEPELFRPLPYFPPEIAKGEPLNISSDLYCLGFMMYEMLTGTVPYAGLPKTSIRGKLAFDQTDPTFNFPDTVPEAVCDLIRNISRNKTQDRLQDATHVLTIINQQLAKLAPEEEKHSSPPVETATATSEARPAPTVDNRGGTNAQTSLPSNSPAVEKPSLRKAPSVQRPKSAVDYGEVQKADRLRKFGIAIVCVLLLGIASSLGYWYRDYIEAQLSVFQVQLEPASPAAGSPHRSPNENEVTIIPTQDGLSSQESQIGEAKPTSETLEDQSGSSHLPMEEPPASIEPLSPVQVVPPQRIPPSSVVVTPPSEKGTKNISSRQPATPTVPPRQPVSPATKTPIAKPTAPYIQQQVPVTAPAASELVPPASSKGTKNTRLRQPTTPTVPPQQAVSPTRKKAPITQPTPPPMQQQLPAKASAISEPAPPASNKDTKDARLRQPTTPTVPPQQAVPPTRNKAPIAQPAPPPLQPQLPAKSSATSEPAPPASDKSIKDLAPRQPATPTVPPGQAVSPTRKKAPIAQPTPLPVQQQPPVSAPQTPDIATPPTAKPVTDETQKNPIVIEPPTDRISQKKESTNSARPSTDETPTPLLQETPKILDPMDHSATEIPVVEKP